MTENVFHSGNREAGKTRPRVILALLAMIVIATVATFFASFTLFERQVVSVAESQKALYERSLNEALKQHQHLPFILSQNPVLREALTRGDAAGLSKSLRAFAEAANLEAVYVMSMTGDVLAASNFAEESSFLGQNYRFRPYFQQATQGARSDFFAIGATTGRPGYFVAEPLYAITGDIIGVVAIKLDISELQAAWVDRGEFVLALNQDDIVILSSSPDWLYKSVGDLTENKRAKISDSRQFGTETLMPLDWHVISADKIRLDGVSYYLTTGQTDWRDWSVQYLTPVAQVYRQTLITTALLGAIIAVLIGVATYLRSIRIASALQASQRHRHRLITANQQLVKAQSELKRTSKLAALGQLSASVTHELGQPISALKNHLAAAEINQEITSPETAENLRRLTERMENITRQMRFFARAEEDEWQQVDLSRVVDDAMSLLDHDFRSAGLQVEWLRSNDSFVVDGHETQLEQCVVNLLRNAMHASAGADVPQVWIDLDRINDNIQLRISDNGSGLEGKQLSDLQEPFFTTKSSGVGLGLGLSITAEIIRSHGGDLRATDGTVNGAVFTMRLPESSEEKT
ncbi:MAG: ATP-binding protein [Pseudoruegeria sp.]